REQWETVLQKLQTGEMPPKGLPRPPAAELKAVIEWLKLAFEKADAEIKPDPGRVTARRLNRAEYNNTVRDLLGVTFRPADDFPQDDSGYGFDNIGDVLSLSPVLMEKYLNAAEQVARTAVFGAPPLKPTNVRLRTTRAELKDHFTPLTDYDLTGLSMPNAWHGKHVFPVEADYKFHVFLGGVRPAGSDPVNLALWIDHQQVSTINFDPTQFATFETDRQGFGGTTADFTYRVAAGEHAIAVSFLKMYEGLPANYAGPNPSSRPVPPPPPFRPPRKDPTPERIAEARALYEAKLKERIAVNRATISNLEIIGPTNQAKGAAAVSLGKWRTCDAQTTECAHQLIAQLVRRAYRRPVTNAETDRLFKLFALVRRSGDSFEEALVQSFQAILVSPHFLFRIEPDTQTGQRQLNDHELAARLSYFLWSSMPDEQLFALAERGALRQPETLKQQVNRMLRDLKSDALVENFGGQWLELRKLESVKPDKDRFPFFDEYLRTSMQRETELFFAHLLREDRSIVEFLTADYSFLNEKLARFYQVPNVSGPEFRRVLLPAVSQRGGLLTQASVLTVSSYANRTSPVLRGKWILENILNAPPPPAPPGVPNLEDNKLGASASLRQQLEAHRANATCAACHSRMDPLGFGLENFDAVGQWRTRDGKFEIDSSGTLPDGRAFKGAQELNRILQADRDAFATGLSEKLLTYALGRGLERADKPVVRKIAKNIAANDYRFSSLVMEIVTSLPFQYRKG
ncbi:MAG: DUF1592 domain-containing protein, partial [Acidobacteria bacterium]|nr:DUF1592 domain-containing protein [Acidobacteriota bacterium]